MSIDKENLDDFNIVGASRAELKYFALNKYGLKLSMSMSENTMREKIQEHCISNDLEKPVARVEANTRGGGNRSKRHKQFYINISKSEKPGGDEPVFVGYNGVGYKIPRGIKVAVPAPLVEILNNAVTDIVTQDEDGLIHHNEVPTYPFTVLGPVEQTGEMVA